MWLPLRERAQAIIAALQEAYPDARCSLDYGSPYQLLVATVLSAQCTDERVNQVTPAFFARFPTLETLAEAQQGEVEEVIRSTGFYRNKARNLIAAARKIGQEFDGKVPATMEQLLRIPGVARKTANVVLSNAFGVYEGIAVDTHVARLAGRLGLTEASDPVKIERDLMAILPREAWGFTNHAMIAHGRAVCLARKPRCQECRLAAWCPRIGVEG
ncbi:MAG: endonuclease III [Chloroflexi bacterium]|nr:endonuclease III [Chloroflexota bacterium]